MQFSSSKDKGMATPNIDGLTCCVQEMIIKTPEDKLKNESVDPLNGFLAFGASLKPI